MIQKNIISVPSNVTVLKYNDFYRDFFENELDFGSITFRKSNERHGLDMLCFVYDTRQGEPFYYTCAFVERTHDEQPRYD